MDSMPTRTPRIAAKFGPPVFGLTRVALALLGLALFSGCAAQAPSSPPGQTAEEATMIAAGRDLVVARCASCHAIDGSMKSPLADAPPLRTVLEQYDSDNLADHLIEGIRVGHDDMPVFDLSVIAADALIAYLKSIN
jgi:mono/diheme cytochrome c family protein